jgi:uncharacterized protein with FMN-binding domain
MQSRRARTVVVALSSLAVVGSLSGCSGESLAASVTGPKSGTHHSAEPVVAIPTQTPTETPTATATTAPTAAPAAAPKAAAPTQPSTAPVVAPSPAPSTASSAYKDGNYSATGTYNSPGGKETLRVTLDLKNDLISDLAVTSVQINSTAVPYETAFEGGIQSVAVGKDISTLNIGPVAGSSLSSIGFNHAITTIKGLAAN